MKIKQLLSFCAASCLLFSANTFGQIKDASGKFSISGYADAYYAYYTDSVGVNEYQKFAAVSPRSNAFGLNTALVTLQYDDTAKIRGVVTLHYGDIANVLWPADYRNIMEAHAGVRLCKTLWLDAGFFRTHFGAEGVLPKENMASSMTIHSYYQPFFESGFRLNYIPTEKLAINLYVLNGNNMFTDNNDKKSIGVLATYALSDKGNIGYDNYIGDDTPKGDSISHTRVHQNFFLNYQINKLKIQLAVDYCMQQNSTIAIVKGVESASNAGNPWASMFSGIASLKYQFRPKCAGYLRGEMFDDPEGFMSTIIVDKDNFYSGYQLWGATAGVEYKPTDNSFLRLEARNLQMQESQEIFRWNGEAEDSRLEVMVNMGISF